MAKDIRKYASPEYVANMKKWQTVRDCFNGSDAMKEAGETYLPRLKGQTQEDYDNYKFRALFFPITGKTCSTMVGMATFKAPKVEYPAEMEALFKDDEGSHQFTEFYVGTFTEISLMGRYGVLIDAPMLGGEPKYVPYLTENIIRWDLDSEGQCTSLLLRERKTIPGDSKFESKQVCIIRHCFLLNGTYCQQELDEELDPISDVVVPTFSGSTIDFIPFVPFGASGIHFWVDRPPMLDIATINVSHYMTSADLEWGRHIVGLPTPVVSGVDSSTKLHIGGTAAWILPAIESKAFYLEFLGQGLGSLENAMKEKIGLMASVSARLVDQSTRGSESLEAVKLRYMSETAALVHIIGSIENGMNVLYNMMARLKKADGQVKIRFSREVLGSTITFKDLQILFEAYLNNEISKESLLYNMRRLDAVDPNRSDAEELAAIKEPPPPQTQIQAKPVGAAA